MSSILECNRIVGSVYPYSLNFTTLFASHLSSILTLFFLKSLVKLLFHDGRSSILTQVLLFISSFIAINVHVARDLLPTSTSCQPPPLTNLHLLLTSTSCQPPPLPN